MKRKHYLILSLAPVFALSVGCLKLPSTRTDAQKDTKIALPHAQHADRVVPPVDDAAAVIISVPTDNDLYFGKEKISLEVLADRLSDSLKRARADKTVYLAADNNVSEGAIMRIADKLRKHGVTDMKCLVDQADDFTGPVSHVLTLQLPSEPDPKRDLTTLKPNPLTLVVSIAADLKLKLNQEPTGTTTDPEPLRQWLLKIFRQRTEQHAYRPEMRTRTDVMESERIEKTMIIKADKSVHYGDVIRVIDAVQGADAKPIILQLDDDFLLTIPES